MFQDQMPDSDPRPTQHPPLPALRGLTAPDDASVVMASLPLPRGMDPRVRIDGCQTQALTLARWPGADGEPGDPKQILLVGLGDGTPETLQLQADASQPAPLSVDGRQPRPLPADWAGATPEIRVVSEKKTGMLMRETNELVLRRGEREIGLRMGLRHADVWQWWQFVNLEELWAGPVCRAYRAAGFIAVETVPESFFQEAMKSNTGYWLHRHNWLVGEIYFLVFANGLVRITARHVNNRFVDKGGEFTDILPVIGLRSETPGAIDVPLDGSQRDFDLGGAYLDLERCSDLHGAEHPGRLWRDGEMLVLQPYTGVEMSFGEYEPKVEHRLDADERRIWAGVARSVGFDLSLAPAPVRTRRFLPPFGWQAYSGMLWPDGALPVRGPMDAWLQKFKAETPRAYSGLISHRFMNTSAFWDGEFAYGLMLHAYRDHDATYYRAALHNATAWADIGIDHTDYSIRIWYQRINSTGPVLNRTLGLLAAYLEEGDPYMLRIAESVADAVYALDAGNWPRRGYGRDGAYIRSLTRLYDVTGERHYLRRAREAARRAIQCQYPDGSYGDQGNGVEAHGHSCEIIKPWMSAILNEVLVDYLERAPDDERVAAAVMRNADWLLSVQVHGEDDGPYWPYEVAWGRNDGPPYAALKEGVSATHPAGEAQLDYLARMLLWASRRTGDPRYSDAWTATYVRRYLKQENLHSSYWAVKVPENFTWHEAHLWSVRWTPAGLATDPALDLIAADRQATVELPDGSRRALSRVGSEILIETPESA